MKKPVVFGVNPREKACGISQFGLNMEAVLKHSTQFEYAFREPVTETEYRMLLEEYRPDFILWNFYPCTMPWVTLDVLNIARDLGIRQASIFHEIPITGFDALIYPDPTFTDRSRNLVDWFSIGRPIPRLMPEDDRIVNLDDPIIGSSGFGFENKGYVRLIQMVNEQFERATVRLHLPFAKWGDEDGSRALRIVDECKRVAKTGIRLEFTHSFFSQMEYVTWLRGNDLNAFLYDEMPGRGIASTIDFALMANKPIAVTKTTMFRHLHKLIPSVCVEDRSLREIIQSGTMPLFELQYAFSPDLFCERMDTIVSHVMSGQTNRLLTNSDRDELHGTVDMMRESVPEMMERKIPEANVQQAWILSKVIETGLDSILCVGSFEDTAFETLRFHGRDVFGIDPVVNMGLATFRKRDGRQFECVFATSVIEHVQDDEQFIRDLCDSLVPDGVCILTTDFKEGWEKGQPLPATDVRFYTSADMPRIARILREKGCYFVDKPDTSGVPDFHYQGHDYSFLGLIFKKL